MKFGIQLVWCAANLIGSYLLLSTDSRNSVPSKLLQEPEGPIHISVGKTDVAGTPRSIFQQLYDPNLNAFVIKLRSVSCPEETLRDIIKFEASHGQQSFLPDLDANVAYQGTRDPLFSLTQDLAEFEWAWGNYVRTTNALGYSVEFPLPRGEMARSYSFLTNEPPLSEAKLSCLMQVNSSYWRKVEELLTRTRGFWTQEDIIELHHLKENRLKLYTECHE